MTNRKKISADFNSRSRADRLHAVTRPGAAMAVPEGGAFFEDLQRIEGSAAWRRLKDIYQFRPGTHYEVQNRLTHTVMAQSVGAALCRRLGLRRDSEDLVRAIVAAHDIGHPPFGHRGEHAIQAKLAPYGMQWNHDAAGLRVVADLDLTLDVTEGLAKRYWRFVKDAPVGYFNHDRGELPDSVLAIDRDFNLHLDRHNHIEGQIACISDWIAFTSTDIEDGLKLGEFTLEEVRGASALVASVIDGFPANDNAGVPSLDGAALSRRIRESLIADVIGQTRKNLDAAAAAGRLNRAEDVRDLDHLTVGFSPEVLKQVRALDRLGVDSSPGLTQGNEYCQVFVEHMFDALLSGEIAMRADWQKKFGALEDEAERARFVALYLTCVATDQDVLDFMAVHRPDVYGQVPARAGQSACGFRPEGP